MKSQSIYTRFLLVFALILFGVSAVVNAQTTGKLSGKVTDSETGEPLPGANVQIVGTQMGAATSMDGEYFIINVPPGTYDVKAQYMGYTPMTVTNVRVGVNRTTEQDFKLKQEVIAGEEVVVEADKAVIKKDQTSSIRNVSSEQMEILPVESVGAVVNLQAGVVVGHFRGGRSGEVNYMIDGMQVTDAYNHGQTVGITKDAVEEVEVIKGTFNAEYGRAMSGIVNQVTKSGSNEFHGFAKGYLGNYLTPHKDIFIGLEDTDFDRRQDYQFQLSGPVIKDKLNFMVNYRHQDNHGEHNGINMFLPDDQSFFNTDDSTQWFSEKSGDSSFVPMNWNISHNLTGKLTSKLTSDLKVSLLYIYNQGKGQGYSHYNKYKPYGRSEWHDQSHMGALTLNHMLSSRLFYELKFKYSDNWNGSYLFENPLSDGYIHGRYNNGTGPGFAFGGQDRGHYERNLYSAQAKLDLTWQLHENHSIKTGLDLVQNEIDVSSKSILNWYELYDPANVDRYRPWVLGDSSRASDIYNKKPIDFAAYIQDKMEFEEMVLNVGLRYDYYDPQTTYPSDRRNPVNLIESAPQTDYVEADPQYQLSPRLGLSYQLSDQALLHFSYGHFFQRPPYQNFYQNNSLLIAPQNFETTQGNPQLKAEKTVQYEIGLWQQLARGMGLEVNLFYRDIYNLRSVAVRYTYNQQIYGLYTNKDYGNAKGLEVTFDWELDNVYANANYTLQYTRGNADNPSTTYSRLGNNLDPIPRLIPMSWDQRHTFNTSIGYQTKVWNLSLTGRYGSGTPYTFSPLPESTLSGVLLYPNNSQKPATYSFDLNGYYNFALPRDLRLQLQVYVYNLFDTLNEHGVYGRTGRAYTNIIRESERNNHRSDFNTIEDRFQNPAMYSSPRMVKVGLGIMF